jgi:hypothetical protein
MKRLQTITDKKESVRALMEIPGVGKSIANDLWNIGIRSVKELKRRDPEELYELSNRYAGAVQDRCLLYVFRCAVYFASTKSEKQKPEKLKWWNWKN